MNTVGKDVKKKMVSFLNLAETKALARTSQQESKFDHGQHTHCCAMTKRGTECLRAIQTQSDLTPSCLEFCQQHLKLRVRDWISSLPVPTRPTTIVLSPTLNLTWSVYLSARYRPPRPNLRVVMETKWNQVPGTAWENAMSRGMRNNWEEYNMWLKLALGEKESKQIAVLHHPLRRSSHFIWILNGDDNPSRPHHWIGGWDGPLLDKSAVDYVLSLLLAYPTVLSPIITPVHSPHCS